MQKKASELLCSTVFFLLVLACLPCAVFTCNCLHIILAHDQSCSPLLHTDLFAIIDSLTAQQFCADLEEEQRDDVVHVMFRRPVVPGEVLIR